MGVSDGSLAMRFKKHVVHIAQADAENHHSPGGAVAIQASASPRLMRSAA